MSFPQLDLDSGTDQRWVVYEMDFNLINLDAISGYRAYRLVTEGWG